MWCFWPPFWTRKKSLRFRNRKIAGNPSGFIPTVQSQRGSLAAELDREPLAAATATGRDDLATATGGHTGAEAVRTGAADVVGLVGALHRDVPWVTRRLRRRGSGNCPGRAPVNKGTDRYQRTSLLSNASPPGGPSAALRSLSCRRGLSRLQCSASTVVHITKVAQNSGPRLICSVPTRTRAGSATGPAARPDFQCGPLVGSTSQLPRPDPRKVACLESRFTTLPHSTGLRSAQGRCQARPGSRGRSIPRRSRAACAPFPEQKQPLTLSSPSSLAPSPTARVKEPSRVATPSWARRGWKPQRPERPDSKTGQLLHGHPPDRTVSPSCLRPGGPKFGLRALNFCPARAGP